jgi:hypothetical protein
MAKRQKKSQKEIRPDPAGLGAEPADDPADEPRRVAKAADGTVAGDDYVAKIQAKRQQTVRAVLSNRRRVNLSRLERMPHDLYVRMLEYIRAGAYDHTAAQVVGVTRSTFNKWMKRGEEARGGIYAKFYDDVMEARATPKIIAESRVFAEQPLAWLRLGPGKSDWAESNVTKVKLDAEVNHSGRVEGGVPISDLAVAEALAVMEEIGLILPGPNALKALHHQGEQPTNGNTPHSNDDAIIDISLRPSSNGNGHKANNGNGHSS